MTPPPLLAALWQRFQFSPNDAQLRAILHTDGPLYLPAGPGSGKTRVLLWRTVNLIACQGVAPDALFLSTFTEKAADQLREGVRALLGAVTNETGQPYDVERMYVGTVHSLCQRLLSDRRFYPDRHASRPPALMDELSQYFQLYRKRRWTEFLDGLDLGDEPCGPINALFGDKSVSRHVAVTNCLSLFNRLSEECLDKAVWEGKQFDPALDDCLRALLSVYERYRAALAEPPRTDFALLQQEAFRVVTGYAGPPLFEHVIVDEYQDTNTIQERLFFALSGGTKNLCVVGDDDQALYRFRGATVENFVQFSTRCVNHFGQEPQKIPLATNYRSRRQIVDCYTDFMAWADWSRDGAKGGRRPGTPYGGDHYRVPDKGIHAHSTDDGPAVVATAPGPGADVATELAGLCRRLLDEGAVANANQIAFLFPSLKSVQVGRIKQALEAVGLKVYAPRAGTFLEVDEATAVLGLFLRVFGRPHADFEPPEGSDFYRYHKWMDGAWAMAGALMDADASLKDFVKDRKGEIARVQSDLEALSAVVTKNAWDVVGPYDLATMKRALVTAPGLSDEAKKILGSFYFERIVEARAKEGQPFTLRYIVNRATSLDWNPLDLFYRLCGFGHFKAMFGLAEDGTDEGPICNLGLVSQYLARFMEEYASVLTAQLLQGEGFQRLLFSSYLYVLFRRGESEFEDAEDPFPRGRIPFLTIHQSKGLEFPVVVLGNPDKRDRGPQAVERLVAPLLSRTGEPLDRMSEFDTMRLFYVALSRAQNLLVLAYPKGVGVQTFGAFKPLLEGPVARVAGFDVSGVPKAKLDHDDTPRNYSFTADYLMYDKCPRQYMIFRKYGFVPSRSQTMMFGSLVHRTVEDLHQFLIAHRTGGPS